MYVCGGDRVCVANIKWAWARATFQHPVVPRSAPTRESVTQSSCLAPGPTSPALVLLKLLVKQLHMQNVL